jgi:O-acetyl-ADP-ribose deacetylase (regulator of RNase III)
MEVLLKNTKIELFQGDITTLEVDGIVNAANNRFWMGGGVAGAIKRKGGSVIESEAVAQGPKPIGEVVVTSAGNLPAKYVIHAVVMGQDLVTNAQIIGKATLNTLNKAEELGVSSLAFPALGTGVGRFPLEECAKIMLGKAVDFLRKGEDIKLRLIIFALYDKEAFQAFEKEIGKFKRWYTGMKG